MVYLEHQPGPPLAPWVSKLWYCRAPDALPGYERILPTGDSQWIFNLAADSLTGCTGPGCLTAMAPELIVGFRAQYEVIDTADLNELMGIVFIPGGMRRFVAEPAHAFRSADVDLSAVIGPASLSLREQLREAASPHARFQRLENFLQLRLRNSQPHPAVSLALHSLLARPGVRTVAGLSAHTGLSERRLRSLFHEEVGAGPKMLARVLRFGHVVRRLHAGARICWPELALESGYSDQSHFANDFRAFSGINPTTYVQTPRPWANHVRA